LDFSALLLLVEAISPSIFSVDLPKKPFQLFDLCLTYILPDLKDGKMGPDLCLTFLVAPQAASDPAARCHSYVNYVVFLYARSKMK
jgi:hypothetical protein